MFFNKLNKFLKVLVSLILYFLSWVSIWQNEEIS
jgi:hypothetical protein